MRARRCASPRALGHLSEELEDTDESSVLVPEGGAYGREGGPSRPSTTPVRSPAEDDNDYRDLPKIVVHQLNMEEQMIFGALQTLSEEACEDALQQQESTDLLPTTLSYTPSTEDLRKSGIDVMVGGDEVDMMYLQSSPMLPHRVVTHIPDGDNISLASSNFSPTRNATGASISRTPSTRTGGSIGSNFAWNGASQDKRKQSNLSRKDSEESIRDAAGMYRTGHSDRRDSRKDSRKISKDSRKDSRDSMGYPVDSHQGKDTFSDFQDSDKSKRSDSVTSTGRFNQQPVPDTENPLGPPKPKSSLASSSKLSAQFDHSSAKSSYPTVTFADDAREAYRLRNDGVTADEVMSDPEYPSGRDEVSASLLRAPMGQRRQRPRSLNLSSSLQSKSSDLEEHSPEDMQLQFEELGSLPNLNEDGIPMATRPNIAQQISATSMEKVRKLKQHIRRVMNPQEGNGSGSLSGSVSADDPEASPLVVSTPVTAMDNNNMVFSPGSAEMNNIADGNLSRRSSNPVSPTKPHDDLERETHV